MASNVCTIISPSAIIANYLPDEHVQTVAEVECDGKMYVVSVSDGAVSGVHAWESLWLSNRSPRLKNHRMVEGLTGGGSVPGPWGDIRRRYWGRRLARLTGLTNIGARPRGCCSRGPYSALLSVFIIFSRWSCASKAEQYGLSFGAVLRAQRGP